MFTLMVAKMLRLLPNQAKKNPLITRQPVKMKKDVIVETSVQPAGISLYYPLESEQESFPVYINFHGGAFIMNEKEMDDPYCRYLANQAKCVVINVDYAKAPEYPFPKPIEQGYEVIQWLKRNAGELNIDEEKIMVGGQSSGANIAAALCLYLEEKGDSQPLLQVLSCPMLDFATPHADKPEPDKWRARYPQAAHFLNMCYVPGKEQAEHPHASPVRAEVSEGLASALILIAEYDAFRPEAEYYAEKLKAAGVNVQEELFRDCKHAFTHNGPKESAEEAWRMVASAIKAAAESYGN
ncbi:MULTISPECIES: alpha/beta hydrolase [Bacillus]|uniref:Carboxylesterase n=2 Tax=Bacillus infantis TaxID=324767 RepID=U5L702_9BACI|nr:MULTISPECIES: alpha/beta hydrolase [Bacillus]AGX02536.1 carboxylesterase [Bacillus infantis NRRL B-14911]MCP1156789.1 alpha/beta hydrolase [Bacillus infantis]MDT0160903.1 alpha/beta hydrolase [Bacillus sp. AG4(2022)]